MLLRGPKTAAQAQSEAEKISPVTRAPSPIAPDDPHPRWLFYFQAFSFHVLICDAFEFCIASFSEVSRKLNKTRVVLVNVFMVNLE